MTGSPVKVTEPAGRRWKIVAKWLVVAVAVGFLGKALHDQWPAVSQTLRHVPVWAVLGSVVAAAVAVTCSSEQQRTILGSLGHRVPTLPWMRVYFVAQLGKYVPGTGWAYVAQMELAKKRGIGRVASVLAMMLGAGLTVLLALVFGALVLDGPGLRWIPTWIGWAVVGASAAAVTILALRPDVIAAVLRHAPSRVRTRGLDGVRAGSLVVPIAWSTLAWVAYGLHLWLLIAPMGLEGATGMATALGGFPVAWAVGFLVLFVPAGVGVREAMLVSVLAPLLSDGAALAAAVLSRFLIIVAESALLALTPALRPVRLRLRKPGANARS